MTIEKGEEIFGKRWNGWTEAEWDEYMKVLTVNELRLPLILRKVWEYYQAGKLYLLPEETFCKAMELLPSPPSICN